MATGGPRQPWEQQPDESSAAFAAFGAYRDMGPGRSVDAAYRATKAAPARREGSAEAAPNGKRAPRNWYGWSAANRWLERAAAYDRHLEQARLAARVRVEETHEAKRTRQRLAAEDVRLALARQQYAKSFEILQTGLYEVRKETTRVDADGRTVHVTQIFEPSRWALRDAARLAKSAADLEDGVFYPPDRGEGAAPAVAAPAPPPADEVQAEANKRVEAFRAVARSRMLTMPPGPPGDDEDGPERNGSGPH